MSKRASSSGTPSPVKSTRTSARLASKAAPLPPHRGYGKLIVFGEHFVVYQRPALVGALSAYTFADVELADPALWSCGLTVVDEREAVPGYKDEKKDEMLASTKLVLQHFGVDIEKRAVRVRFGGPLCAVSGVGASAASCVALARALNAELGRNMTEDEINAAAFEGEKGYHGTPSGIDNTAATFGGLLKYQRNPDGLPPSFSKCEVPNPFYVVFASTGITSSTTKVVGDVAKNRTENRAKYDELEAKYLDIFARGETAMAAGDWAQVGKLCDENHTVLQDLTVSCKELDDLVLAARQAGALGAKLAGTGRGGLMFAVCADQASQEQVLKALSGLSPQVWATTMG